LRFSAETRDFRQEPKISGPKSSKSDRNFEISGGTSTVSIQNLTFCVIERPFGLPKRRRRPPRTEPWPEYGVRGPRQQRVAVRGDKRLLDGKAPR
jgi:hypothetical protein